MMREGEKVGKRMRMAGETIYYNSLLQRRGLLNASCIAAAEGEDGADEEDCSAEFAPLVQLNEVETVSGEEAENILVDL